jgi:hypothetical protein
MPQPQDGPIIRRNDGAVPPALIRGEPVRGQYRRPVYQSPWARHVELARQNPPWERPDGEFVGGWVLCARIKYAHGRGSKETWRLINNDKDRLWNYVDKAFPLERFQLSICTVADTWCDRELFIRYLYTLSVEEDILDRKRRKERFEARMRRRMELKAERRLAAALAEQKSQARRGVEG